MDIDQLWTNYTYVAFDLETSGAWPVGCDVVEFGAVKWQGGREIGQLQFLIKPRELMTDFIIGIHGITNEMVQDAPPMSAVIKEISEFFKGSIPMAHHAPFDMGFIALDLEAHRLPLPLEPVLCTSLLARKLIHGTENHKLQTLVKHLKIDGGNAHRALDDARACLQVGLHCLNILGPEATLRRALEVQEKRLYWQNFALFNSTDENVRAICQASREKSRIEFLYDRSPARRMAAPMGLVRSPDGDFMQAFCLKDQKAKRFYLEKIREAMVIPGADFDPSSAAGSPSED